MLCSTCTSAVVDFAALEISMYAQAWKTLISLLIVHAALVLSVIQYSVKFYPTHRW